MNSTIIENSLYMLRYGRDKFISYKCGYILCEKCHLGKINNGYNKRCYKLNKEQEHIACYRNLGIRFLAKG